MFHVYYIILSTLSQFVRFLHNYPAVSCCLNYLISAFSLYYSTQHIFLHPSYFLTVFISSLSSLNPCSNSHIYLNNKLEDDVQPLHYYIHIFCLYHISSISSHPPEIMSANQTWKKTEIVSDRIVFNLGQPPESIAFTATEKSALSPIVVLSVGTFYMWYFRKKLL